jgi:hypothetical protein
MMALDDNGAHPCFSSLPRGLNGVDAPRKQRRRRVNVQVN